jgi:exopolyphosphatase / guanosine-5'-triphosphate,3'-diphosphate pyrophosphatase
LQKPAVEDAPGRLNGSGPVAIVDIGSNSVRLVVYERLGRSMTPLFNEKELCGLVRGVGAGGRIDPEAIASALTAIRRFVALTRQMGDVALNVIATAAAREASNGGEFIGAVEKVTGTKVTILSGAEEARLSALGIVAGFHDPDGIAGDLGGGSRWKSSTFAAPTSAPAKPSRSAASGWRKHRKSR